MEIILREDNPYANGEILVISADVSELNRNKISNYPGSERDKYIIIKDTDSITELAFTHLGNSKYWWILADVNNIEFPFELPVGKSFIIPDFDVIKILLN